MFVAGSYIYSPTDKSGPKDGVISGSACLLGVNNYMEAAGNAYWVNNYVEDKF